MHSVLCHKHSPKTFFLESFVFILQLVLVVFFKIYNGNLRLQNHGIFICHFLDMECFFLYSMNSFKFITEFHLGIFLIHSQMDMCVCVCVCVCVCISMCVYFYLGVFLIHP